MSTLRACFRLNDIKKNYHTHVHANHRQNFNAALRDDLRRAA